MKTFKPPHYRKVTKLRPETGNGTNGTTPTTVATAVSSVATAQDSEPVVITSRNGGRPEYSIIYEARCHLCRSIIKVTKDSGTKQCSRGHSFLAMTQIDFDRYETEKRRRPTPEQLASLPDAVFHGNAIRCPYAGCEMPIKNPHIGLYECLGKNCPGGKFIIPDTQAVRDLIDRVTKRLQREATRAAEELPDGW